MCHDCFKLITKINKPFCNCCGKAISLDIDEDLKCIKCMHKKSSFDKMRFLFKFDEKSKKIIHSLKYMDKTSISKFVTRLIYFRYFEEIQDYDAIIPVPMHKLKRLMRFYNQSELLAKDLEKFASKTVLSNVLYKSKMTPPQMSLRGKERVNNVKNSFSIKNCELIYDKNIILIDDVITTGATIENCAKLLKNAGAKSILVLGIAHT